MPTLNEAPSIGLMIGSIPVAGLMENGYETYLYMADGRSVDRTQEIAVLFLAPCCVFSIETIVDMTSSWLRVDKNLALKLKYAALIIVLVPYFCSIMVSFLRSLSTRQIMLFIPCKSRATEPLNTPILITKAGLTWFRHRFRLKASTLAPGFQAR